MGADGCVHLPVDFHVASAPRPILFSSLPQSLDLARGRQQTGQHIAVWEEAGEKSSISRIQELELGESKKEIGDLACGTLKTLAAFCVG
jgi:hypothetical protein